MSLFDIDSARDLPKDFRPERGGLYDSAAKIEVVQDEHLSSWWNENQRLRNPYVQNCSDNSGMHGPNDVRYYGMVSWQRGPWLC